MVVFNHDNFYRYEKLQASEKISLIAFIKTKSLSLTINSRNTYALKNNLVVFLKPK